DNPSRNILNYGVFHICRVLWWVLVNEQDMDPRDETAVMAVAREENNLLETAYARANTILSEVVDENNESLINLNNYFKKAQSQQNINQHLQRQLDEAREAAEG
ncbi:MAG: hypothetical protein MI923_06425, partial [Phycisphaerales bacterium]|nr:hypothetical protein [Phycisphaerales bacterium]